MKIEFLGTGGAFDIEQGNSSAIVQLNNENILIDCGFSVFPLLVKKGLANKIDKVLITHLHDDHVGGLSSYILYYYFKLNLGRIKILYPNALFKQEILSFLNHTTIQAERFIDFLPIEKESLIEYIDTTHQHITDMTSFGYVFKEEKETIVFSGDIANAETVFNWLSSHGIDSATVFHDICFKHDGVHTFYKDLVPFTKKHSVFGYHCNHHNNVKDNPIPLVANCQDYLWTADKDENSFKITVSKWA